MDKKSIILNVAETLFLENGYRGTTVRQIAQQADVNVAMISYYFGSKDLLLQELIESRVKIFSQKLDELSKDKNIEPEEKMATAIDLFIKRILSNIRVSAIFHREVSVMEKQSLKKRVIKNLNSNADSIKNIILEGQKKGIYKNDVDVELMVLTIISAIVQFAQARFYVKNILKIDVVAINEKEKQALMVRLKKHMMSLIEHNLKK